MLELRIERASGEVIEFELTPGAKVPAIQAGDKVRIVTPAGQQVQAEVRGNDVVVTTSGDAGQAGQPIVFENMALYLGDDRTAFAVVDAATGETIEVADVADLADLGATVPLQVASGEAPPPPPSPSGSSTIFQNSDDIDQPDEGGPEDLLQAILERPEVGTGEQGRGGSDIGGVESNPTPTPTPEPIVSPIVITLNGNVVDGYIVGATVFADADGDGVQDTGEAFTTTGANGAFTLVGGSGPLVMTGGIDVSTGEFFKGTLTAPAGSTVVTPLTTLIQSLVEAGQTVAAAESAVKTAFGLASDLDLTDFDPVKGVEDGVTGAGNALAAAIQIQNTVVQAASVLQGAGGSGVALGTATNAVYAQLASAVRTNSSSSPIDSAAEIQAIITSAADDSSLGLGATAKTQVSNAAASASTIIYDLVDAIDDLSSTGNTLLTNLAQIAYVAQNGSAEALYDALDAVQGTGGNADLTTATNDYSAAGALNTAINNAASEIGTVGTASDAGTTGDDVINGTAGNDTFDGGAGNDVISGSGGNDMLLGGAGNDILNGDAGNDTLIGGAGTNTLNGGAGIDTAKFSGDFADFTITAAGGGTDVTLTIAGSAGSDSVKTVEILKFNDLTVRVAGGGSEYATLAAAIDAAAAGERILLTGSTTFPSGTLTLSKKVSLQAAGSDPAVTIASDGALVIDGSLMGSVTGLDLSGIPGTTAVRFTDLGNIASITTASGQTVTLAAADLDDLTVSGAGTVSVVGGTVPDGDDLSGISSAISVPSGTLTLSAAQADGLTITGAGAVAVTALGSTQVDLSDITVTGAKTVAVSSTATLAAGTDLGDFSVSVAASQTLTLSAAQANGATIGGAGNVTVSGISATTDLSDVDPSGTLTVTVASSLDISDAANLGTVDTFQLAGALTLTAAQASGIGITGTGAATIIGLAATTDLSGVDTTGTVTATVAATLDISGNANLGPVDVFTIAAGQTLTLSAAQADGATITGGAGVVIAGNVTASADLTDIASPLGFGADGTIDVASGQTLTLTVAQAAGQTVTGDGTVLIDGDVAASANLTDISAAVDFTGNTVAVAAGQTLTLTAAQAGDTAITGAGTVALSGNATGADLSAITADVAVPAGATLTLNTAQLAGLDGGAIPVSGDGTVALSGNATSLGSLGTYVTADLAVADAVSGVDLTITAGQANNLTLAGPGTVSITGLGTDAVNLSDIAASATVTASGNVTLDAATDLGTATLVIAAGQTVSMTAAQASELTITGGGTLVITSGTLDSPDDFAGWSVTSIDLTDATLDLPGDALNLPNTSEFHLTYAQVDALTGGITGTDQANTLIVDVSGAFGVGVTTATIDVNISSLGGGNDHVVFDFGANAGNTLILDTGSTIALDGGNDTLEASNGTVDISGATISGVENLEINSTIVMSATQFAGLENLNELAGAGEIVIKIDPTDTDFFVDGEPATLDLSAFTSFVPGGSTPPTVRVIADGYTGEFGGTDGVVTLTGTGLPTLTIDLPVNAEGASDPDSLAVIVLLEADSATNALGGFLATGRNYFNSDMTVFNGTQFAALVEAIEDEDDGIGGTNARDVDIIKFSGPIVLSADIDLSGLDVAVDFNGYAVEVPTGRALELTAEQANGGTITGTGSVVVSGIAEVTGDLDLSGITAANATIEINANLTLGSESDWNLGNLSLTVTAPAVLTLSAAQADGMTIAGTGSVVITGLDSDPVDLSGIIPSGGVTATVSADLALSGLTDLGNVALTLDDGVFLTLSRAQLDGRTVDGDAATLRFGGDATAIDLGNVDAAITFEVVAGRTLTLTAAQASGHAIEGAGNLVVAGVTAGTNLTDIDTSGTVTATVTASADLSGVDLDAVDILQVAAGQTLTLATGQIDGLAIAGAGNVTVTGLGSDAVDLSAITATGDLVARVTGPVTLAAGTKLGGFDVQVDAEALTLTAAQANGLTITGTGSVVVTDLGGAAADLSDITADASATVSGAVILPAGTVLGDVEVSVSGTLTLAAAQANGAIIAGSGAVFVTGLAADTDLSDVDPTGTLTATVTGSIDIGGNTNLDTVEAFQVAAGQTLTLSADQASGLPITGAGSVAVTGLGGAAVDMSKVAVTGSRTIDVGADTTLAAGTDLGTFTVTVADDAELTLSAAQAAGKAIGGDGDVTVIGLGSTAVDLSTITATGELVAVLAGDATLAAGTDLNGFSVDTDGHAFTLTAAQANDLSISGAGDVTVTDLGITAVNLAGVTATGTKTVEIAKSLTLAEGTNLGDFDISVDSGQTFTLTAAQTVGVGIAGEGHVTVTGLTATTNLSAITATGTVTATVTGTVDASANATLGAVDVYQVSGTLALTADQATGKTLSGAGTVTINGLAATTDLSNVAAGLAVTAVVSGTANITDNDNLGAVDTFDVTGSLTLSAAQADGQTIGGTGNVTISGLGTTAVDLSAIAATVAATAAIVGDLTLAEATELGSVRLTVAADQTLHLTAEQADGRIITGSGSVIITGTVTDDIDLNGIADTLVLSLPETGTVLSIEAGTTADLTVAEANAYDEITGEGTLALSGNATEVFSELTAKIADTVTLTVPEDGILVLTTEQADGFDIGGDGAVAISGDARSADLGGISAALAVVDGTELTLTAEQVDGTTIDVAAAGKLVVDVSFDALDADNEALPVYDLGNVTVGGADMFTDLEAVWNHIDVASDDIADKFMLFWTNQDAAYYASDPLGQSVAINRAGVELGNLYVAYLAGADGELGTADDGAPILDVVQTKILEGGEGVPAFESRQQSLHENLLNNLSDAAITSRFLSKGEEDPRSADAQEFGDRPALPGYLEDGLYPDLAASAVIAWDIAHGITYPATLPAPYAGLDGDNTLTGTAADNYLYGGGGDDVIDGGAGVDTVAYNGDRGAFDVSYDSDTGTWTVDEDEGTDTLANIEKIVFGDGSTLAFNATLANGFNVGTGNASTGFVIDTSPDGIEVGLKAKEAYLGNDLSPDMGTYHAVAGAGQQSAAPGNINPLRAKWNIEYSIDLTGSGKTLGDLDVKLALDTDPASGAPGSTFVLDFNAIPGYTPEQQSAVSALTVLQDSQNLGFDFWDAYFETFGFDPRMPGEYRFTLTVADPVSGELVGETTIVVDVQPGAIVDGSRDPADDGEANDNGVAQYATLQAAIAAAAAGDVIVANDADADTLILDKALTLLTGSEPGEYDYAGIVYDDDGVLRIDMSELPVDTLDLSGLNPTVALEVAELGEDETLILAAEQADGLIIDGDGTVVVTGAVEDGDFSNITASLDLSGATLTGDVVMSEEVGAERTLTLTAAQASGQNIGGEGTVTITGDVAGIVNLTGIAAFLTFGEAPLNVGDGAKLTLTAEQANGQEIGGNGTVVVTGTFEDDADFSNITSSLDLSGAMLTGDISLPETIDAGKTLTLTAEQADGQSVGGDGTVIVGGTFADGFDDEVVLDEAGGWIVDRSEPAEFEVDGETFEDNSVLRQTIGADEDVAPFYQTQGRQFDLVEGTTEMSVDLHIPTDWSPETGGSFRWAGFWGVATDAAGEIVNYPIIEFSTLNGVATFRAWESDSGWHDFGLPSDFAYGQFYTLTITLQADGTFLYQVGDVTYTSGVYDAVEIDRVILQGYNQIPGDSAEDPTSGRGYDIYWDNLEAQPVVYIDDDIDLTGIEGTVQFADVVFVAEDATLTLTAEQANGQTITGDGTVTIDGEVTGTVDLTDIAATLEFAEGTLAVDAEASLKMTAAQVDAANIDVDADGTLVVDVAFDALSTSNNALPEIDISEIRVNGSNNPADVWDVVEVSSGDAADKFKLFWISADKQYYDALPTGGDVNVNRAFVELGNLYIAYLEAGGAPILDVVQTKVSGTPNYAGRQQTLHDNILGNLQDGVIAGRFGSDDPRSEAAKVFGSRPYFEGTVTSTGLYSNAAALAAVIGWDLAHGYDYTDDLSGPYAVLIADDNFTSNATDNYLYGGAGADTLSGGAGDDTLYGGADNDTLVGGTGADALSGGAGIDTADYSASTAAVNVNLGTGAAQSGGDAAGDTLSGIENVTGSDYADILTGGAGDNVLTGGAGNDTLSGGAGDDTLIGGAGDDTLTGGAGDDTIDGGEGIDTAVYSGKASDFTIADDGTGHLVVTDTNALNGDAGRDTVSGVEHLSFLDGTILVVGAGSHYATIQSAIDAASAGDTIVIAGGTYTEALSVTKGITLKAAAGADVVVDPVSGSGLTIDGDLAGGDVTLKGLTFAGGSSGIYLNTNTDVGTLTLDGVTVEDNSNYGLRTNSGALSDLVVTDSTFENNGFAFSESGSSSHLKLYNFTGNATLTDVTIVGAPDGTDQNNRPDYAIELVGVENVDLETIVPTTPIGTVTFTNVTVSGEFHKNGVAIYNYGDVDGLTINGLDLSGAETNWGPVFNIDGITDDVDASDFVLTLPDNGAIVTELQGEVADQTDTDTVIEGTSANDRLMGKTGDDTLYGGAGDDELYGADKPGQTAATVDEIGNDTLYGGAGNDKLYGGAGNDVLDGGTGNDTLDGGAGTDVAAFSGARSNYSIDMGAGTVTSAADGTDTLSNIEALKFADGFHVLPGMSIQAAIDAAQPGDTIHVAAGVYNLSGTIIIDKPITLLGAQAEVDPRTAAGERTAGSAEESIIDGGGTLANLIVIASDGVTVSGFEIRNGTGDLIRSNETTDLIEDPVVSYNIIHGSSGDEGIQLKSSDGALVEYNHVYDTAGDGINLSGNSASHSLAGTIANNEVHDLGSPDAGIYVYNAEGTTISGNLVYNIQANDGIKVGDKGGSDAATVGATVTNNVVHDTAQDGITVYMSGVTVSGNEVSGSNSENGAIYVGYNVSDVAITGNDIHDNGSDGDAVTTYAIRIGKSGYAASDVMIEGNTFEGNESQLFDNGGALNLEAVLAGNTFVDGGTLVAGGASPRTLTIAVGTDGIDTLAGTDGADALSGRAGSDSLAGGAGDDILAGGAGDDALDGGAGTDTAGFSGAFGDYAIALNGDGTFTVTDIRTGSPDGTDTLDGVEALSFAGSDGKVLLVGGSGYATIQAAIDAASAGDTIFIGAGDYALTVTLNVNKAITLQGESETGVIIDANAVSGYGVLLTASGATLSDFTLHGPATAGASSYGLKVSPNGTADAISDITLQDLTVAESYKTQIDLNGVHDSTLSNVTANGTGTASGNGLTLTDSSNIIVNNLETIANPWGGVAIYTDGNHYPGGSDGITFTGSFSATESAATNGASPIYIQLTGNIYEVTNLTLPDGYDYAVTNSEFRPEGEEFTFFFDTQESADAFADHLETFGGTSVVSTPDADVIGGDGYLFGAAGDDTLTGGAGDDRLAGGTGNDTLDGGSGMDAAVFAGDRADYTLGLDAQGRVTVTDTNTANGNDGADTLIDVETLKFADGETRVWVVGGANADFADIQDAIDAAGEGDTILVAPGTYAPFATSFDGPANITILGTEGATITTTASGPARLVDLRADGTTFSGFTIEGPGGLAEAGVHVGISISGRGVTVEDNSISDILTGIQTNTQYLAGDNSITGNTVNAEYGISLQNTGNTVSGNTVTASVEGIGIYGGMVNTASDNNFTITDGGEALALYPNKYNGSVSLDLVTSENTVTVGEGTNLQDAINLAGMDGTVNLGAGTYTEQVTLDKQGLTMAGADGAKIVVPDGPDVNGITITADGVTVSGLTIEGPVVQSYLTYGWSGVTRGIVVKNGADDFTITDNAIQNIRTGILIDGRNTGSVEDNVIDNTKSGISIQYTDGAGITISGNVEGTYGNEWGLNIHLNGHMVDGAIVSNATPISAAPTADWQQTLLNISDANADWSVQDQAYVSGNRTHVTVDDTGSTTSQGSQLTPVTLQVGLDAVVAGGEVHVNAGDYSGEDGVVHTQGLTITGDAGANGITLALADGITGVTLLGEADVSVTGNALDNTLTGGAGDDVLVGGDGDDTLAGGDGSDVASFAGARSGYAIAVNENGTIDVADANAADGDEGTDTLSNVEVLKFTDGFRVLDGMSIQAAVDAAEPGDTIYVEAGTYDGQVLVNKAGLAIVGMDGAKIAVGTPATTAFADRTVAFTVAANGVAISGFEMTGPLITSFTDLDFATQGYVYGVFINNGVQDLTLSGNTIYDVRTGVTFEGNNTADVSGNDIYNTRGAFLIRSDGVDLHDNSFGTVGNEWDVTYLAGTQDGDYFTSPFVSEAQYGEDMMALSAANNDMTIVDRRYGMNGDITNQYAVDTEERDLAFNFANRSHVEVEAGVDNTLGAATGEPTSRGNGLGHPRVPLDSLQDGVDAVVAGGYVHVRAGDYSAEDVVIRSEGITIDGDAFATGISVELGAGIANVTLLGTADFTATGNALDNMLSGGDGDDIFIGGDGNDTFTGGAGNDIFTFMADDTGIDTVTDFEEGDALDFSDILSDTHELLFESDGSGNTQVSYEGEAIAIIQNVASTDLTVDDSGNVVLADTTV